MRVSQVVEAIRVIFARATLPSLPDPCDSGSTRAFRREAFRDPLDDDAEPAVLLLLLLRH